MVQGLICSYLSKPNEMTDMKRFELTGVKGRVTPQHSFSKEQPGSNRPDGGQYEGLAGTAGISVKGSKGSSLLPKKTLIVHPLVAMITLLMLLGGCTKDEPQEEVLTSNPLESSLDLLVDEHVRPYISQEEHVAISLAIMQDGEALTYHYGETEKGNHTLPQDRSLYEIGSITKTFTAAIAVDYFLEQGIDLKTPVSDLLPANLPLLAHDGVVMTLEHLLNHTSGLPRLPENFGEGMNERDPYVHYSKNKIMNYLLTFTPTNAPGEVFEYSNLGFALIGILMEDHSGKSYSQLVADYISTPLGLNHTKVGLSASEKEWVVHPYGANGERGYHWDFADYRSAGAVVSNLTDMISYAQAQMSAYAGAKQEIFSHTKISTFALNNATEIGLGWFLITAKNQGVDYFHNGGTGGFCSYMRINPDSGAAVIMFSNNAYQDESETLAAEIFSSL